jgi:hypothetical protein
VFADLFDYGYTNTMEAELDKIEYAVNGDSGIDEIYENLCGKTLEDIKSRLTAIKNIKVEYRIDENHVLCQSVWSVHKARRRRQSRRRTARARRGRRRVQFEYIPVRTDIVLDMVRLKNNGYSASELLCFDKSRLGDYKDVGVHIRTESSGRILSTAMRNSIWEVP